MEYFDLERDVIDAGIARLVADELSTASVWGIKRFLLNAKPDDEADFIVRFRITRREGIGGGVAATLEVFDVEQEQ